MVEQCGGLNRVALLQHRQNDLISEKSVQIIRIFFPDEDQTDEEIAPKTYKPDKFKENRDRRNKGHKGGKRGPDRNLGTNKETTGYSNCPMAGAEWEAKKLVFMI
jgi:hypothetical protein